MTRRITLMFIALVVALCSGAAINCLHGNAAGPVAPKRFKLVIDAGHGGHDPGAVGRISKEKNINLATALEFGRLVAKNCPNVDVVYTRKTDVFVTLQGRAQKANREKADLFVSIHTNALPKGHIARGAETYTLGMARAEANLAVAKRENSVILVESDYKTRYEGFDPNSSESYIIFELIQNQNMAQSVSFGKKLQQQFRATGRNDKGVHQAGFLVLRETTMPSVLIELGYITTPDEERFLASSDGQRKMGNAIYKAFLDYYKAQMQADAKPVPDDGKEPDDSRQQEEAASEIPVTEPEPVSTTPDASAIEFRVQFASGGKRKLSQYSDLKDVAMYNDNGVCKYTAGRFATFKEAQRYRNTIEKRYKGAFVVAFRNGQRIPIDEARRLAQ